MLERANAVQNRWDDVHNIIHDYLSQFSKVWRYWVNRFKFSARRTSIISINVNPHNDGTLSI